MKTTVENKNTKKTGRKIGAEGEKNDGSGTQRLRLQTNGSMLDAMFSRKEHYMGKVLYE